MTISNSLRETTQQYHGVFQPTTKKIEDLVKDEVDVKLK
jgi:heme oxygenase